MLSMMLDGTCTSKHLSFSQADKAQDIAEQAARKAGSCPCCRLRDAGFRVCYWYNMCEWRISIHGLIKSFGNV